MAKRGRPSLNQEHAFMGKAPRIVPKEPSSWDLMLSNLGMTHEQAVLDARRKVVDARVRRWVLANYFRRYVPEAVIEVCEVVKETV